ncbi:MAG TPA: LPS assembly lipoprotein LptE [Thermoanaerobaculia bacterium]
MRLKHPAALGLLLLSLTGCGYALVGRASSNVPDDIREVYVRPLVNQTQRTQVEQALTRAIAEEMVTRNRFSVVGSADAADAELSGTVVGFDVRPVTFDASGRATQYEIVVVAQIAFKRVGSEDVIWSNDRYVFRESYEAQATETAYFDREDTAIEEAAEKFAETMVSDLLEGF